MRRAKTVRPLRTAAGQEAGSKPRTAEATSSSCCSRHGRRPVPSQNSKAAHTRAQQQAKAPATSRAPPKRPTARAALVAGLGLCRAKNSTPLRPLLTDICAQFLTQRHCVHQSFSLADCTAMTQQGPPPRVDGESILRDSNRHYVRSPPADSVALHDARATTVRT